MAHFAMLRTKLFLNLIPFMAILLAMGGYAVVLISRLAHTVDVTVMENYQSAIAAQLMSVATSRMETGLHLAMEGDTNSGASFFKENSRVFEQNLALQTTNAPALKETELTAQLRTNYLSLHRVGLAILALSTGRDQQRAFETNAVPQILAINVLLEKIQNSSQSNILATSQNIQQINHHITRLMIAGTIIALVISAYASFKLGKSILEPIQLLTRATREVGQGNLDQTVPVLSNDEFGELANAFNKMAAQIKAFRESTSEKIIRLHHTMESTLASFPDPIFVLDREGHIELKNRAAEELCKRLGLNDTLPARLPEMAGNVLKNRKDFLPHSFKEVLSFRVNGEEKSFLPRILIMRGEENNPVGVAVVLYDVTRFRLLDDAKTNLVSTVSHELKTPLTSVRMVLHLLLEKTLGPVAPKQEELLQTARRDAERLLRILNDLLDLARFETGHSELNKERVTPVELIQSISEETQRRVTEQGLRFHCSIQPQLPAVLADRLRIEHVFQNLLSNAIKHSPPGGEIQLRVKQTENGGIQFSVRDQGPGISEEYQGRVFERFFRVPGQSKTGAGLGLSIAREITVAHGGRIGVHSQPGKGTEFFLVLPVADEETKFTEKHANG